MKRTNVVLDEELLEEAKLATGERTYSATITRALEAVVRRRRLEQAIAAIRATPGDPFAPGYVEELLPSVKHKPQRVSADERRAPKKRATRRRATR